MASRTDTACPSPIITSGPESPFPVEHVPNHVNQTPGDAQTDPAQPVEKGEDQFQYLRRKLQYELLWEKHQKEWNMKQVSTWVEQLESIESPSADRLRVAKIPTLLRKIKNLPEFPQDELRVRERVEVLYLRFLAIVDSQERNVPSPPLSQDVSPNESLETVRPLPELMPIIDLTGLSDTENPPQSLCTGKARTKKASASSDSSAGSARKRKRPVLAANPGSDMCESESPGLSGGSIEETVANENGQPSRRLRKSPRTSFRQYMKNENLWMDDSEKRLQSMHKSLDKIGELMFEKRRLNNERDLLDTRIRSLDETMRDLYEMNRNEVADFRMELFKWQDMDREVTREWESLG